MKTQPKLSQKQKEELASFSQTTKHVGEFRRVQAILYVNAASPAAMIREFTRFSRSQAFAIRRAYFQIGLEALRDKRRSNRDRVLTKPQRDQVVATLMTKAPKDVFGDYANTYWTTGLLGKYITQEFGTRYKSKTSQYLIFKEAKLTFHCPGKSYEKTDPAKIAAWEKLQTDGRSQLQRAWKNPDTVILCGDEMVLTSKTMIQKVWLPQGQSPPVLETNTTRKNRSVYGFLSLKDGTEHAFMTDWQNMYITVDVLKQLRDVYPDKQLLLVWDNCGWHKGSQVKKWIRKDGRTDVLWFPPYSPELNPQEHVWKAGRKAVTHNEHITDIVTTTKALMTHITTQKFAYELCGLRPQIPAGLGAV